MDINETEIEELFSQLWVAGYNLELHNRVGSFCVLSRYLNLTEYDSSMINLNVTIENHYHGQIDNLTINE